jgi:hypothetical protein
MQLGWPMFRGQARYGSAGVINPVGSHLTAREPRRKQSSRAARAREKREQMPVDPDSIRHKSEPRDPSIRWLLPESEDGNVEYKLRLKDPAAARLEQLV